MNTLLSKTTGHEALTDSKLRLRHEVHEARWDDQRQRWLLRTSGGDHSARVLICAAGPLSDPAVPDLPGIDGFAGTVFHSARWRHDHDLTGERVAVIGTGIDRVYPETNRTLRQALVERGAVASELPLGTPPLATNFPRRNRIISGLTDATVVVEAPAKSGALITASWALEQGRGCFIVPGPLDSRASAGSLAFLREFAELTHLVAGIPQLIADLGFTGDGHPGRDALALASAQELGITEAVIAQALVGGHATVDELVAATDLPVATVLSALTLLQRRGLASGAHGRYRPAGTLVGEQSVFWKDADESRPRSVARAGQPLLP